MITQLPLALFAMSLSTAIFPRMADQAARGDTASLVASVRKTLQTIMFFTIPATVGLLLLREPATVLLLQRGEFTAADAAITSAAVGFYCLGIVPQAGIEIHSRGFYALGNTKTPVLFAVGAVLLNCILSALLWEEYGVKGLAFSVSAAAWLEWGFLYAIYRRSVDLAAFSGLLGFAKTALAASLMALGMALVAGQFGIDSTSGAVKWALSGALVGTTIFAAASLALGIDEARSVLNRLTQRFASGE